MLRWLIAILILANLLAFGAIRGLFGPAPLTTTTGNKQLNRQIHPEGLLVRPIRASESVDVPVVGGPMADSTVKATELSSQ